MTIKARIKVGLAVTICVLLAYGAVIVQMDRTMGRLSQEMQEANDLVSSISMLRTLTQDYLLYRTGRAQRQWSAVYDEVRQLLEQQEFIALMGEYDIGDAPLKLKIVADTFSRLMTLHEISGGPHDPAAATEGELQNRLTTQLLLATQDLLTRFRSMTEEINRKLIATQRFITSLDIVALLTLGVLLISNAIFLQRSVVKPVLKLQAGAEIIGAGNLDHKVGIDSRDEIGVLSNALDAMAANLKNLTVSRDELAMEIEERKIVEQQLTMQKEQLQKLNQEISRIASFPQLNPSPVLEIDPSGAITYHNPAAARVLEKSSPEIGLTEFLPLDLEEIRVAARLQGETIFYREVKIRDTVFAEHIYLAAPFDVLRIYAVDITAQKKFLEDLQRSNQELEQFAYISSHDLQEPLRKIANFSDMLLHQYQGQLDERAERYFGYITEGAKRLQALINDLLSYSRVGRAEMPLAPTSLEDILKGTFSDLQALIQESGAEISHDPLPVLQVNPHQMGRLLQNLIANGIKFHGNGSPPRIHLAARREGQEWVISIRDTGIGFDQQYAEGIFKVFKRLHAKEEYPGTGIGLAICKKIVERHGGRIWAESEPGRGATFYFTIPA